MPKSRAEIAVYLLSRVDMSGPPARTRRASGNCWIWTGHINADTYGRVMINRVRKNAHRAVYELLVGSVPDGMVLDHLCRTTACVRPDHLEPVTPAVNVQRGLNGELREWPTHCAAGHDMRDGNYYERRKPDGSLLGRQCKECHRKHRADWAERKAQALLAMS